MTKLYVGYVTKFNILLPHVTHWDATHAVGLVTKPKNVQVKEVSQEGVLHIHQQEEWVNLGRRPMQEYLNMRIQRPIVIDILRNGDMRLIKEVLEVPTTQSGVGHATMLVTLLHISIRWGVIVAVALGINLKIVGVHGNNSWEFSYTTHQGKPIQMKEQILKRQMPRSKYGWRRPSSCR